MVLRVLKHSRLLHLCFAITFFTSGLIVNLVQCILYYTLWFINRTLYRKINWYLCYTLYAQLVFLGEWWGEIRIKFYMDKNEFQKYFAKELGFAVMNHSYEIDWMVNWLLADRTHSLGNCKAFSKKNIQYVPVMGWCWKFAEFVFLERSFEKDREIIRRQIAHLAEYPSAIMLLLYPEGTRFTPEKHKASIEFARKRNLPELKHHLLPRTKGFVASVPWMRGKIPAVYDMTLAFDPEDSANATFRNLLSGGSVSAHLYIQRIPLKNIPQTEEEQEAFLRELMLKKAEVYSIMSAVTQPDVRLGFGRCIYICSESQAALTAICTTTARSALAQESADALEKLTVRNRDKMRESFLKTGSYFATSGEPDLQPFTLDRRIHSLINEIVWSILVLVPMLYYLIRLLFSGQLLYFSIGAGIIGIFNLLLLKALGMTEIKNGSSYGISTSSKTE